MNERANDGTHGHTNELRVTKQLNGPMRQMAVLHGEFFHKQKMYFFTTQQCRWPIAIRSRFSPV